MLTTLILVVLLLAANAFFVAAEFALVKVRPTRLEPLAEEGSLTARLTLGILRDIEAHLAACQLGITMASLGLGWVGEPFVAALLEPAFRLAGLSDELLHAVSFLAGFLIFSSLHIVLGEQVPKTFAIREPIRIALWCALPLRAFFLAVWPLNWALDRSARAVLRMLGAREIGHADVYSAEELQALVHIAHRHGQVRRLERDMLAAILELGEVEVAEVMVPRGRMVTLPADLTLPEAVERIGAQPYSRYPVWRDDPETIVGIVHARELLLEAWRRRDEAARVRVGDLAMPPWFVPETTPLLTQLVAFRRRGQHMAVVVDEYGTVLGIVTLEDILEEIVGDIVDEKDVEYPGIRIEADGSVVVEGGVSVRDLNRHMDWNLPEDEAVTVAGLVIARAERIPEPGESFEIDGFRFTVEERRRHRLTRIRIHPPAELRRAAA
ncbi:Magnesium and cobalt efflux protein CorC [bacterium HR39]|nr:Magnesium and cobalt efflux protein CorC [bacterium HR39]